MKKFLAVATALVLAISSLCVFVFADDEVEISFSDVSVTGRWSSSTTYPANSDGSLTVDYTSQYQEIWFVVPSTVTGTITSVTVNVTSGTASDLCLKIYDENNTAVVTKYNSNTYTLTADEVTTLSSASTVKIAIMYQGTAGETYTFSSVTVTTQETSTDDDDDEDTPVATLTVNSDSTGWTVYGSSYSDVDDDQNAYMFTSAEMNAFVSLLNQEGSTLVLTVDASNGWAQAGLNPTYYNTWTTYEDCTVETSNGYYVFTIDGQTIYNSVTSAGYFQLISNGGGLITAEIYVKSSGSDPDPDPDPTTTNSVSGLIYVNDEYHAIKLNGHFIVLAHTDDNGDGVCDLCHQAFSADEEESSDIVMEDVEVEQPAEDTDTETEEDGEDIDVGDTDSDAEETTDSNPTTGVVLALVPMAIAGFAVVSSKRR